MKTISILTDTRQQLRDMADDGESVNDVLTRLLDDMEPVVQTPPKRTNINLSEENLERLKELKSYPTEPYNSIILRLMDSH